MYEGGNSLCLRIPQYRETGISTHTNHGIGLKRFDDASYLPETFYQFIWQSDIFNQRTSVKTGYIQPLYRIPRLRHFFHFHFSFGANKQDVDAGLQLTQCMCYCHCWKNVSARSAACYNNPAPPGPPGGGEM